MRTVKIYKVYRQCDILNPSASYNLTGQYDSDNRWECDGGVDYILPDGYGVADDMTHCPQIYAPNGKCCEIVDHPIHLPQLISTNRGVGSAPILWPVNALRTWRLTAYGKDTLYAYGTQAQAAEWCDRNNAGRDVDWWYYEAVLSRDDDNNFRDGDKKRGPDFDLAEELAVIDN